MAHKETAIGGNGRGDACKDVDVLLIGAGPATLGVLINALKSSR